MSGIARRIEALETQLGQESRLLIVGIHSDESDDDAINREAAVQKVALEDVAAALVFRTYAPPVPSTDSEEERIEWAEKYCSEPIKIVHLRPHTIAEQAALKERVRAMIEDSIKSLSAEDQKKRPGVAHERSQET